MSIQKVEMTVERIENGQYVEQVVYPFVEYDHVAMENGMDIMSMIRDDVSTPMVTHNTTSWKVGQGDSDVSETIVDSSVASMTIKGQTYQNILPNPSLRNSMTIGKTMQKLNEGYDSVNTVDGVCKSAILSGNTLVNLCKNYEWNGTRTVIYYFSQKLKEQTTYIAFVNTIDNIQSLSLVNSSHIPVVGSNRVGNTYKMTTGSDVSSIYALDIVLVSAPPEKPDFQVVLLEYQEGMENWDIPYFEGMTSCKMPVLCTTGKNLFDSSTEIVTGQGINSTNGLPYNASSHSCTGFLRVKSNTTYTITQSHNRTWVFAYNKNKEYIKVVKTDILSGGNFTTPNDTYYIRLDFNTANTSEIVNGVQIEEGSVATSYEPYKTNILTVNENVELRGIGNVKDELDLETGKLTQRIDAVVLPGENNAISLQSDFLNQNDTIGFSITCSNGLWGEGSNSTSLSNYFRVYSQTFLHSNDIEGISQGYNRIYVRVNRDKLNTQDIDGFKQWLSNNPTTVCYQLKTESVKTVDLSILDQDNQPVAQLNSFANGYIQVSSQGLIPTAEYEVPTSNSCHVDLMKANTQYTMKNMQGAFTIDGIQYNASVNGTFTSPSALSNRLMITNVVQTQPMLLEGDMTSKEVPYVEGIKSAFEGADKVEIVSQNADNTLSNTTSFQLSNPLRSLPNSVRDEIVLDRVNHKAKIIQRVGEDLTQLATPIITEVNLEGYPYVYKGGHIFLNTEIAPMTEVKYSINQAHQIESSNEDILRHQKEINQLYELIAQYVQVQYETELIDIALQG